MFRVVDLEPLESPGRLQALQEDPFNMYIMLGTNVMGMMRNFDSQHMPYLILIDLNTGERKKLIFDEDPEGKEDSP